VQSNPASHHEKKAWQSGGVHVRVFGIEIELQQGSVQVPVPGPIQIQRHDLGG
jgi:hypothetical protein